MIDGKKSMNPSWFTPITPPILRAVLGEANKKEAASIFNAHVT